MLVCGVVGTGHGHVIHLPQGFDAAAAQRLAERGDAAQHLPLAQPLVGEVLVVGDDFNGQALGSQRVERRQRPRGNAVGIDGHRHALLLAATAYRAGGQLFQVILEVCTQQAQHFGVLEQQLPCRSGLERAAAHHQHRAHLGLQCAQALRHR
jgi:hypothetical protein